MGCAFCFWLFSVAMGGGPKTSLPEPALDKGKRSYQTSRIKDEAPLVDGTLNDPAWQDVPWSGKFIQRVPADGLPPSQQTQFKVIYNDNALFFAFRMHDDPSQLSSLMDRRDRFPGDWIEVNIDSYGDRRTAFSFTLSLSGTRGDEFISNDGNNWDSNWDPVWRGAAKKDEQGWTAEARIPLSQLRFSSEPVQTWGLQVQRRVFRLEERSTWQYIPKNGSGWVSKFGELHGLRNLKPKRRFELLPYAVSGGRRAAADINDPFFDGEEGIFEGGLDGKYGLTNNLTLDFTINPDFGQVEADPSQVNLTSFETFFDEKRPFFIEGRNILELRLAPAITGGDFTRDRLFYSRRIGRPPGHRPNGEFVDQPDRTSILGAFKLTGKTRNGLSIGVLDSVTQRETAAIANGNQFSREAVEPTTNYFVGRVQQDYRNGDTQLGTMLTAVNRDIKDEQLAFMTEKAYAGGIDFATYFKNRSYRLNANFMGSKLRGSSAAISAAQTSSARYFQRPDNESANFDPNRTTLDGSAGSVRFGRTSKHNLVFETGVAYRSPGFEINDLGFMRNADQVNQFLWVAYQKRNPFSVFDRLEINGNQWADWDTSGNWLGSRFNMNTNAHFSNKRSFNMGITRTNDFRSNTQLRGGPASLWPGNWHYNGQLFSDSRNKFVYSFGGSIRQGDEGSSKYNEVWAEVLFRPTNAMRISLNPSTNRNQPEMQYVTTETVLGEECYLFGRLDQKTTSLTIRLDWAITPNLTFQFYGAPFISTGRFSEFKRITNPTAGSYRNRFATFGPSFISRQNGRFLVDENGDGATDYQFSDPDFDAREFNSNLVVRWEYQPGSTFFLVWSQARANFGRTGMDPSVSDDLDTLFSSHPENVVLLKISKWFTP